MVHVFDYVIVGGGTAGSVITSRLSTALPSASFLLIEAGPSDVDDSRLEPSQGFVAGFNSNVEWNHFTVPQKSLGGKILSQPQGRVLGGSSAINYQAWTRGPAVDFDQWAAIVGDQRWSWSGLLPFFKKTENFFPSEILKGKDLSETHGFEGPVKIAQVSNSGVPRNYPLKAMVAEAYESVGVVQNTDGNTGNVLGFSEAASSTYKGKRQWASSAYKPGDNHNVNTWIETCAEKLFFEGKKAVGVQVYRTVSKKAPERLTVIARKEILVCSGVQGSPKLLLLSGIGPAEELRRHNIPQLCELPVGLNYSDHPFFYTFWKFRDSGLSLGDMPIITPDCDWTAGLPGDWVAWHRHEEDHIKIVAERDLDRDAFERMMAKGKPHTESFPMYGHIDLSGTGEPHPGGSTMIVVNVLINPTSRGSIKLQSSDPKDPPLLDPKILSNEIDRLLLHAVGKLTITAMNGLVGKKYGVQEYGIDESLRGSVSESALDARLLRTIDTINHGSGSCAMGSVVDSECRVNGIQSLRVIDASVFPQSIGAHYQAAVYAISEQVAQIIIEEQKL